MNISIIIPVYNTGKYLQQCLDSVLNQTYKNLEIIVVNDGSTDNSLEIAQKYAEKDTRIIVINQENKGQSSARNAGMKIATSEYIFFIDSDDYIALDSCESIYNEIKDGTCEVLIFGRKRFWDHTNYMVYDKIQLDGKSYEKGRDYLLANMALDTFTASPCNKVFKKDFLNENFIIFERGIIYEDLLFVFKCLLCSQDIRLINKPFYFYRQSRKGSVVSTIKEKDKDVLVSINLMEQFIRQMDPDLLDSNELKVLIYRWVCSAVVFKYPCKAPFSREANQIVRYIIKDKRFNKYMRFMAYGKGIDLRWKVSAWLALNCYPLYVIIIYGLYVIKKVV